VNGALADVIPPPFNARTRVHESGRGHFVVTEGTFCFSNFADQRLYLQVPRAKPQPITPEADRRYAEGILMDTKAQILEEPSLIHGTGNRDERRELIYEALEEVKLTPDHLIAECHTRL